MLPAARVGRAVKTGYRQPRTVDGHRPDAVCPRRAGRVSLNAIAKEAGVTPAMLHYYFSSRDALVTQLIEERFMPLRNHISRIFVDHPQDPVLALTMMVETLGHMAEKNAQFAPLWMQEIIGEMPILRQHMDARFGEERFQVMLGTVHRWQQEEN